MDSVLFPQYHTCPAAKAIPSQGEDAVKMFTKHGSLEMRVLPPNTPVCTCKFPKIRIPEAVAFFLWQLVIIAGNVHLVWVDAWQCFEPSLFVHKLPSEETPFTFTTEISYWGLRDGQPFVKIACKHNGMEHEYCIQLTASSCEISRGQMLEILTSPAGILVYRTGFIEEAYRRLRPQMSTAAEAYILADTVADKLTKEQITAEAHSFVYTLFSSVGKLA